jgi:hypothetical protein
MKRSGWRLAVAALLFMCWIGYLAYLAATTTQPIVLSRPQFLIADLYVVATVAANPKMEDEPADEVTVKQVVWSANKDDSKLAKIRVKDLHYHKSATPSGWQGPGDYVLALSRNKDDGQSFQVTPLPRTPGFYGLPSGRIYKATPSTLRQLEFVKEEYHH